MHFCCQKQCLLLASFCWDMEATSEINSDLLEPLVFELPGEPAVVINGVPDIPVRSVDENSSEKLTSASESSRNTGFGEWLEGREVQKLFGDKSYSGVVTEFDTETGWYRVVYEDGDFEDLEWHELQDVLQPLDVTVPLKSLALKIIRKSEKSESWSRRNGERKRGAKAADHIRKLKGSYTRS
ncbi:hypothetical protein RND81_01G084400 [Saponaria officinalis]|uniref:PTM/DIR17-like Tudor domain-containing protein n=1 Tax=Saponaria officinalis TaxID=3572 RepID=A0AAW1NDR8_SAPOF